MTKCIKTKKYFFFKNVLNNNNTIIKKAKMKNSKKYRTRGLKGILQLMDDIFFICMNEIP